MSLLSLSDSLQDALVLNQAWERWRDPGLYERFVQAARANPRRGDNSIFRPLNKAQSAAKREMLAHFRGLFGSSQLVAFGRQGSYEAAPTQILAAAWTRAKVNFKKGTVTTDDGRTYFDVRVAERPLTGVSMTDGPPPAAAEQGPSQPSQGTPIAEAHFSHAEHNVIETYRQALKAWQESGKPTTRRVDPFTVHQGVADSAQSSWRRHGSSQGVMAKDPTWLAASEAERALVSSFYKRCLKGDCILDGFHEAKGQRDRVPADVLETADWGSVKIGLLKTVGGAAYHRVVVFERADYESVLAARSPNADRAPDQPFRGNSMEPSLQSRVVDALRRMADAGALSSAYGGQAKAIKEITEQLRQAPEMAPTVKSYIHPIWKTELARSETRKTNRK